MQSVGKLHILWLQNIKKLTSIKKLEGSPDIKIFLEQSPMCVRPYVAHEEEKVINPLTNMCYE